MNHTMACCCLLVASALLLGCSERRYPVAGKIVFDDGTPYQAGGFVALEKGVGKDRIMVKAMIREDGTFVTADGPGGATAGRYQVRLVPPPPDIPEPAPGEVDNPRPKPVPPPKAIQFDKKFLDFKTSDLEWMVAPKAEEFRITLGRPPKT